MKIAAATLVSLALVSFPSSGAETGEAAPAFSLTTAAGERVDLEALRGKVVLLDFWASWCAPCKRSFPWMGEMQRKYGARGLTVVAVNVDRKRADAERFLQLVPAPFVVAFDPAGATPAAYAVPGMPTSYLIDASGRIAYVGQGFHDERKDEVEERIRALLGKGA
jgi:cytochrome c biogenesis protein CcmG/thiol:disulfide interchange protein DsbE